MRLRNKNEFPENNSLVFAVSDSKQKISFFGSNKNKHRGFVGLVLFLDGKWYSMPEKSEVDNMEFFWIDMNK